MTPIPRALAAGVSALALAAPAAAQTAPSPTAVAQAGDSYFVAAQADLEELARPPAERAPGEERHPLRRRRHVDPDGHRRPHPRGPAAGGDGESNRLALETLLPHVALVQDLHPRRPGRRQRPDRDRDGRRGQVEQRHHRRHPGGRERRLRQPEGPRGHHDLRERRGRRLRHRHRLDRPDHPRHPGRHLRQDRAARLGERQPSSATRPGPAAARTSPRSSSTGRPATASR